MRGLPTRLEGPILLAAAVHGDERGVFAGTWREDAWRGATAPLVAGVTGVTGVTGSLPFRYAA